MEPRCLAEHEIADLVFRASAEPGAIFNRYEVGNLLATLFKTEQERNEQGNRAEHLDNTLAVLASNLKIEGSIPDWLSSIKQAIDEIRKDRQEFAHRLVRECLYYTYPDHPNESGWYTCAHCHASQEGRERFPHAPTCIVEKARKYE